MSLRRVDARFVLPAPPASAAVLAPLEGWSEGLRLAGIDVVGATDTAPDLVVSADAAAAAATGAAMALVEGRRARSTLARAYPVVERFLPIPSVEAPQLLLPLSHGRAGDYAIRQWSLATTIRRRARNRLARWLLARGLLPGLRTHFTGGFRTRGDPFVVAAAAQLGVPPGCEWFLTLGSGDPLTRCVFHLFPPGSSDPGWVLKFARVPGYTEPFDRDERGLHIAASAGPVVAERAPKLLGRFEAAGLAASLETAATGTRLTHFLQGRTPRTAKVRAIDAVAEWTIVCALATAKPPDRLASERRRLRDEVLPLWSDFGLSHDLVDGIGPVPAVLQHNDLGSWNVVTHSTSDFVAVDWEAARTDGFPLWDLVYFLTDALMHLDGASSSSVRDAHNRRLFRGELASSKIIFGWLRRAVDALAVPEKSVGPLVTLCWLHHGLSGTARRLAVESHAPVDRIGGEIPDAERIARLWLRTPGLGVSWDSWRQ